MTNKFDNIFNYVAYKMSYEGFDYCFRRYAAFEEVDDEKFHKLRESYIAAADALEEYVKSNANKDFLFLAGLE